MSNLLEDRRQQLIAQGKRGKKEKGDGKSRYEKRLSSRFSPSNRTYNNIDMDALFKNNILTVDVDVKGETDNYTVRMKFGGFLDVLQDQLRKSNNVFDLRTVIRALITAFNTDDVYIHCSCPDFKFRHNFWITMSDLNSGEPEKRPSKITNPYNDLGPGCKHIMLILANTGWLIKVASVIVNYVKYMERSRERLYQEFIYPAIYGKEYEGPIQQDIFGNELDSDKDTIDRANIEARKKGQFTKENPYQYQKQPDKDQLSMSDEEELNDEE